MLTYELGIQIPRMGHVFERRRVISLESSFDGCKKFAVIPAQQSHNPTLATSPAGFL
jgi:hypothetical protein